jgi:16S rRNA processing protein RimM
LSGGGSRICLGVITGPHGVRGAVRVKSFAAVPEDVAAYGPLEDESGARRFELSLAGTGKGVVLARIAGIGDRDAAEALRGTRLYVARAALPAPAADEFYHADLVGLTAVLRDGVVLGEVKAVLSYGAGDSLELRRPDGKVLLVPFTRAAVPEVDVAAGRVVIEPPAGLLEDAVEPPGGVN